LPAAGCKCDPLQEDVVERYDRNPASVSIYRDVVQELIDELGEYSDLEREIIEWDNAGRPPKDFQRLREAAWIFWEMAAASLRA
jgi:hypothetical protein